MKPVSACFMRLTNTITLRSHTKSFAEHETIKQIIIERYGKRVSFEEKTLAKEGFDDIHILIAKLYHQPPQKAFIKDLHENTSNLDELRKEAHRHIDTHCSFYFRINKNSFLTDNWEFVHKGDVIQVRINVCAHPKDYENALACVQQLLA